MVSGSLVALWAMDRDWEDIDWRGQAGPESAVSGDLLGVVQATILNSASIEHVALPLR